ncbi:MAG: response regulator [Deltaproteobacteria bacterium]|nr:MAG: response regulator [Deltaproteobacteria bacterium]
MDTVSGQDRKPQVQYEGPAGAYRVLVVDDEDVVCMVIKEALKAEFDIAFVDSAEKAIPYLLQAPPHVLVADKNLPGISGIELLRQSKSLHPELEVIIITGYASMESSIEAMRQGAYDYILKPFDDISILVEKVRRACQKTELARERNKLFDQVLASNRELQKAQQLLKQSYLEALSGMIAALEARDAYTRGHSERVARLCNKIGLAMGLSRIQLDRLVNGARLHDIGKIGIREDVLNKPGRLTAEEYEHIKKHPEIGAMIVAKIQAFEDYLPVVRHHHERLDGTGYPDGLSGKQIPLEARIVAVADTFDAMTSARPYRSPRTIAHALQVLREVAGTQLDAEVVRVFLQIQPSLEV